MSRYSTIITFTVAVLGARASVLPRADGYTVQVVNKCVRDVNMHFQVPSTAGTVAPTVAQLRSLQSANFSFSPDPSTRQSTFVGWIDNDDREATGPSSATGSLVEATVEFDKHVLWLDISNVNAYTNPWTITPPKDCTNVTDSQPCRPITCHPAEDWSCPVDNRMAQTMGQDELRQPFVTPVQSCLSNCTLLSTDEACCKGAFNDPSRCASSSPALKQACPRAYSYAYDDVAATYIWRWSSQSLFPLLTLISCA